MRIGIYLCECSGNIAGKLDFSQVVSALADVSDLAYVKVFDLPCSQEGLSALAGDLRLENPDRVVIAACSPRDKEELFQRTIEESGINPYLMQMVNVREQVAWVTKDPGQATRKAVTLIKAAIARVRQHQPLEKKSISVCPDVMVIGAGPAGLSAALTLAEAGRRVVLVDMSPAAGGMPVMFDELFPDRECGPCLIAPRLDSIVHGEFEGSIELLTLTKVASLKGYFGNFSVMLEHQPRFIDNSLCIGCGECVAACSELTPSGFDCGLTERKAIDFVSPGELPHVPHIDPGSCIRMKGDPCSKCRDACPIDGAIIYDDVVKTSGRTVGGIIVATGAALLDCSPFMKLGYRDMADVVTSLEFERMLSTEGPYKGSLRTASGEPPSRVAIVHCVGSLDDHPDSGTKPYCSAVCCQAALKYGAVIRDRLPSAEVVHFIRELCLPGQAAGTLFRRAKGDRSTEFIRYDNLTSLSVSSSGARQRMEILDAGGSRISRVVDMVVLCPAVVPAAGAAVLARILGIPTEVYGFFKTVRESVDNVASPIRGIFAVGTCRAPMDISSSVNEGCAAAGRILAELKSEGSIEISPVTAIVDPARCSGCLLCLPLCPRGAISSGPLEHRVEVAEELCNGCGLCVASCPTGAMAGRHFSSEAITAEIAGLFDDDRQ